MTVPSWITRFSNVLFLVDSTLIPEDREGMWHPSQSTETKLNGCIVLRLGVAELGEVKKWLIGFGADALVLKPASLRREIAAEC